MQQQAGGHLVQPVHGQCIRVQRLQARDHAVLVLGAAAGHGQQAGRLLGHQQRVIGVVQVDHGVPYPSKQKRGSRSFPVFCVPTGAGTACISPAGGRRRRALLPARPGSCRCTSG
ncbi:hypothetical protein G6F63_014826 [Rhizopus arrhizus]|nr:hypothetical protein G6F63_014826 [Rhizopus arrhizus]